MRNLKNILPLILILIPSLALSETLDIDEFETWDASQTDPAASAPPARLAKAPVDGQTESNAVRTELELTESSTKATDQPKQDFIIHFGAGAIWTVPLRLADKATDDKVLSVFSASWSPFGLIGEVGFDLAMARNSSFLASPNLKFFFVKHHAFSCYLEGSLAIHSHLAGTDLGGGGGFGMIFGLIDHLAFEIRASAVLLDLSGEVAGQMFSAEDGPAEVSNLVVVPAVGARLLARF